ncbi:helicase family protein with metal-binding cysteine cluster [Frankia sp. QA3]|nr:helicase family protein with metal-binding cysteine cluster [Frankia sp. QA3]
MRDRLVGDYEEFVRGFLTIRSPRIRGHVEDAVARGLLWPEAWLSLNPAFEPGGEVTDLAHGGPDGLHPGCADVFRIGGLPIRLHRHQRDAVELARFGASYVVTTGTGSGKSLTYLVPIVDHVLRTGTGGGIKAIIVYPMNALANSQYEALQSFIGDDPRVTVARYTGQENEERRREILTEPPDILLTNYVMLDLILTRPGERRSLIQRASGLRFLVLDELHTYRGRQGADVAMLVRRVREACGSPMVQCVGTSATLATEGSRERQHQEIARTASTMFGVPVFADHVVAETLRRATIDVPTDSDQLRAAVRRAATPEDLRADPLASWAETQIGLAEEEGRLVRRRPRKLPEVAAELAEVTGLPAEDCERALRETLLAGSRQADAFGRPLFAFRLHQFVGKGDTVYASLEAEDVRHLTTRRQLARPDDPDAILVPLVFCRECGQEYLAVTRRGGRFGVSGTSAEVEDDEQGGYLYVCASDPWPRGQDGVAGRLPDSWLAADGSVLPNRLRLLPEPVQVTSDGRQLGEHDGAGLAAAFVRAPFRFCLNRECRVSYESPRQQDFAKLSSLGSEGRSSATTVLSSSLLRALHGQDGLADDARKLLAFTDNRQDASLQAGHFNDFVQVSLVRAALHQACVAAGPDGLTHEELARAVVRALALPRERYAQVPKAKGFAREDADRALRQVIEYRLYLDLQRGVRITMPNLEQSGLLVLGYRSLDEAVADEEAWRGSALGALADVDRLRLVKVLLDEMRRGLSLRAEVLSAEGFERVQLLAGQHLTELWRLEEQPFVAGRLLPRSKRPNEPRVDQFLSGRSAYGAFLRREVGRLRGHTPSLEETETEIVAMLTVLADEYGIVHRFDEAQSTDPAAAGYQLNAAALVWKAGDGTHRAPDPLRVTVSAQTSQTSDASQTGPDGGNSPGGRPNRYFVRLYQEQARELAELSSAEHTAQVPALVREQRERDFRNANLPVLFCSPTMELGVDISSLNAVLMRNVPPTPANYAQRSGRAGRQSQPALVVTYCTTGSAHDQYYFRRSQDMVAGAVAPPRLDLANADLVRAHVHAIWLAECTREALGSSLVDILDAAGDNPSLALRPEVVAAMSDEAARRQAAQRARRVLAQTPEITTAPWYDEGWAGRVVDRALASFDRACDRWRTLYRNAQTEFAEANRVITDVAASKDAVKAARARRNEAEAQLDLLRNTDTSLDQSDFYTYRYLASEGFLPGYSFPRLPVSAFIPARRGRRQFEGDYLSRPRFLAINEFGPGALVYHEGARYEVYKVARSLRGDTSGQPRLALESAKVCAGCGALHDPADDVCASCGAELGTAWNNLLRMTTASTIRRQRISSDEEERRRQGFDVRTAVAMPLDGPDRRVEAEVRSADGTLLARLYYADTATIRRMNIGLRRRRSKEPTGYRLDAATGRWARRVEQPTDPDDLTATTTTTTTAAGGRAGGFAGGELVIPYVQDSRNALIVDWALDLPPQTLASLQYALKRAVQVVYNVEDSELAAEALPHLWERRRILLYESAEGGAGVLRRLMVDGEFDAVARCALDLLHFDLDGTDRGAPDGVTERCARACYDCLLSYGNQIEHDLLDRFLARPVLLTLADSATHRYRPEADAAPVNSLVSPPSHVPTAHPGAGGGAAEGTGDPDGSVAREGDEPAGRFVGWLRIHGYRLPDATTLLVAAADARPDLVYRLAHGEVGVFVRCDGPGGVDGHTDDAAIDRLAALGWGVIEIGDEKEWASQVAELPSVFGTGSAA